ncbi:MAG: hypothetical protein GY820_14845 [Gammaproteobacteria bacterium]|nr:hypothetical protein [Gammaproteobacteria bacterium]
MIKYGSLDTISWPSNLVRGYGVWLGKLAFLLALLSPTFTMGSMLPSAKPLVFSSPYNDYYFKLVPNSLLGVDGGKGYLYKVSKEQDELLYQTSGWFSFNVILSVNGRYLIRVGDPNNFFLPIEKKLVVEFYDRGKLIQKYHVSDLKPNLSNITRYTGNQEWVKEAGPVTGKSGTLKIVAIDGQETFFDIRTGEILNQR